MITGNCLCGEVVYQLNSDIKTIVFCHCSRCRKQTGTAFNASAIIKKTDLTFIRGESNIKIYASNGVNRHFCSNCGSHIFSVRDNDSNTYRLRIGLINEPIMTEDRIHIYTDSKANWDNICDSYTQYPDAINPSNLTSNNS